MTRSTAFAAALLAGTALLAPPARAGGLFAFGDSAIEMGNLYLLPGLEPAADSPYFRRDGWQRDSNGPVWVEYLAPAIRPVNAGPPYGGAVNFAHSGATTGALDLEHGLPVGLASQVGLFEEAVRSGLVAPAAEDLFVVEAGPNDLLAALLEGRDPAEAGRRAAANLADAARRLVGAGARTVLVWDMPDISRAPALAQGVPVQALPALQAALDRVTAESRQALAAELGRVAAAAPADATLVTVKLNALFGHVRANAAALGFRDIDRPCLDPETGAVCSPDPAEQNRHLFFDGLHLTTRAQELESRYYATLLDQLGGGANRRAGRLADAGAAAGDMAGRLGSAALDGVPDAGLVPVAGGAWARRDHEAGPDAAAGRVTLKGAAGGIGYGDGKGWRVAVGIGALDGRIRFDAGGGARLEGHLATAAGERAFGRWFLASSVASAWFDLNRVERPGGLPTLTVRGGTEGDAHHADLRLGARVRLDGWTAEPSLSLAWSTVEVDGFTERAGAGLEMAFDRFGRDGWTAGARLSLSHDGIALADGVALRPALALAWERALEAPATSVTARLVDNTARPVTALASGGPRGRVEVAPSLALDLGGAVTATAGYARRFGDAAEDRVRLGLGLRF
ncbi:MAG TPA: autotransporter domain-containing protein [Azospirillaceae bacterium]|nr:autotransporter domain-containing protein [Azospirillaceae bacterium]